MNFETRILEKFFRTKKEKLPSEKKEQKYSIELLPPKMGMFDQLFEILARRKKLVTKLNKRLRADPIVNDVLVKIAAIPYRSCSCCIN